jgi:hypothetical protein
VNCINHNATEALAICAYCGRALCRDCIQSPMAKRVVCSSDCEIALERNTKAVQLLLDKSIQSARANAIYCYLGGGLSAGAAVAAWFMLPSPFLIYFTAGCAVVLICSGIWHQRGARDQVTSPHRSAE